MQYLLSNKAKNYEVLCKFVKLLYV